MLFLTTSIFLRVTRRKTEDGIDENVESEMYREKETNGIGIVTERDEFDRRTFAVGSCNRVEI